MKNTLVYKKNNSWKLFHIIMIVSLTNLSCQKYLDIKRNSSQSLIETANDCQLILNDYANMNVGFPSDGEASANDYFIDDATYLSTNLTPEERDLYTWQTTALRAAASPQWQYSYKVVYLCNLVLEALPRLAGKADQTVLDDLKGQALFFRAYSFWQIAQVYARPYNSTTDNTDLGIPLRLSSDINDKSERGTLNQTYTRIVDDFEESYNSLQTNSSVASRPNKISALAMLARVYLTMGKYEEALVRSNLALNSKGQLLDFNNISTTSNTPFERFNKEVIFQSLMVAGLTLSPGSATSNVAKISQDVINSYESNDLRRIIYFKSNSGSSSGTFRFTGNYEPVTTASLFNGLAVDEVYLIRAECNARLGNANAAITDLNTLLKTRYKSGTYIDISLTSIEAILNKVLAERRKELIMRGLRWIDLRRLNSDNRFAVTLSRTVNGNSFTLPPMDARYTLLIPNEVILNSNLTQNSR